jgi:hypothetical protein
MSWNLGQFETPIRVSWLGFEESPPSSPPPSSAATIYSPPCFDISIRFVSRSMLRFYVASSSLFMYWMRQ